MCALSILLKNKNYYFDLKILYKKIHKIRLNLFMIQMFMHRRCLKLTFQNDLPYYFEIKFQHFLQKRHEAIFRILSHIPSVLAKFRPIMGNFFRVTIFLILKKPSGVKNCPLSENAIFRLLS